MLKSTLAEVCALIVLVVSIPAFAEEPVYDLGASNPLAYGKNKKGEDVVCEFRQRTGSNLRMWYCDTRSDLERMEIAAKIWMDEASEKAAQVQGQPNPFGSR